MNKTRKSVVCMLTALFMLVQPFFLSFSVFATVDENDIFPKRSNDSDLFILQIVSNSSPANLEHITIDVYTAEIGYSDTNEGYAEFYETLAFTVTVDKLGIAEFERPSDYFSFTVNLDTLPVGYGISEHTRFIKPSQTEYSISLDVISDVSAIVSSGEYVPELKDDQGRILYANATVSENPIQCNTYTVDAQKSEIILNKDVFVNVYGVIYQRQIPCSFLYHNEAEKLSYLFENELMDEDVYYESLSDYLLSLREDKNSVSFVSGTILLERLNDYLLRNPEKNENNSSASKLIKSYQSVASNSRSSVISNNHKFIVYYDSNSVITSTMATTIANEFDNVHELFCTTWGFRAPTAPYRIEILENTNGTGGITYYNAGGSSYIALPYSTVLAICNGSDSYKGILAHEYMHAIMHLYGFATAVDNDSEWMRESFASWAGVAYAPAFVNYLKGASSQFLSSTWKPLSYFTESGTYDQRHYGTFLFPLYIDQELGGYNTIKAIFTAYGQCGKVPFTAISNGLEQCGYSFKDAFSGFAEFNSEPAYYYDNIPYSYQEYKNDCVYDNTQYPISGPNACVLKLASHYNNFFPQDRDEGYGELNITLDMSNNISGIPVIKTIRHSSLGNQYTQERSISNQRCTIVHYSLGATACNYMTLIVANASVNHELHYAETVTYEPKAVMVRFDPAMGEVGVSGRLYTIGGKYTNLPVPTSIDGSTFMGWTLNGQIVDGNTVVTLTTTHTLTATWSNTYKITNVGANKCLNIYGSNVTSLSNGINVTLWNDSGTNEQKWMIFGSDWTGIHIHSVIDVDYGLNVFRSGSPYNCNVYKIAGNETDATIDIIAIGDSYKIKLTNYNLYLTVGSSSNGTNVYWAAPSSSSYQLWNINAV